MTALKTGVHAFAGAASGALGAVATGGDVGFAAAIGGISAGASAFVGGVFPIARDGLGAFIGRGIQRTAVGAILGGGTSLVMGGSFGQGAAMGARTSAIAYMANEAMHQATEKAVSTLITKKEPGPTKDVNNVSNNTDTPLTPTPGRLLRWGAAALKAAGYKLAGTLMGAAGLALEPGGWGKLSGIIVGGATGVALTSFVPIPGARVAGAIVLGAIGGSIGSYFDEPGAGQPNYNE